MSAWILCATELLRRAFDMRVNQFEDHVRPVKRGDQRLLSLTIQVMSLGRPLLGIKFLDLKSIREPESRDLNNTHLPPRFLCSENPDFRATKTEGKRAMR